MKKVTINRIAFVNFKGLRNATFDFADGVTTIAGRNGSGKTTIFDGFTWLLFGKDSHDRKSFDIKTLDADGVAIPRLPHEVSAVLTVDGEEITLCRRFNEKWVKRRGQMEEEFTGHEEERLYNDVPMSVKEWNEKISGICSEQVFKFITNPAYFVSQKTDVQRTMLFRMAGEVNDADIAKGNADFTALLANLTGKTMDEYKREIQAKKRRVKAEIEAIPDRIDERKRDIAALTGDVSLDIVKATLKDKQAELAEVDAALLDESKRAKVAMEEKTAKVKGIGELRSRRLQREFAIKEEALADYRKAQAKKADIKAQIAVLERRLRSEGTNLNQYNEYLTLCNEKRNKLIAAWKAINADTLTFNEQDFVCPTCHRPFDVADIKAKQDEMTANFNTSKSARLADNVKQGQANTAKMKELQANIDTITANIGTLQGEIKALKESPDYTAELTEPNTASLIEGDAEWKRLTAEIDVLQADVDAPVADGETIQTEFLSETKRNLVATIDAYKKRLANFEAVQRNNDRIAELEEQFRNGSQELADLERIEFTIADFNKARINAIDKRINAMFTIVHFKMFATQINGGEVETCEATVNGVPYSVLNNAMQINAGLDIINAICKFEGITAPIFIDNAESILQPIETASQQIRLYVADEDLNIK